MLYSASPRASARPIKVTFFPRSAPSVMHLASSASIWRSGSPSEAESNSKLGVSERPLALGEMPQARAMTSDTESPGVNTAGLWTEDAGGACAEVVVACPAALGFAASLGELAFAREDIPGIESQPTSAANASGTRKKRKG